MNLLGFLSLIIKLNLSIIEFSIKYFLIQTIGSGLIFISFCFMDVKWLRVLLLVSVFMKINSVPFHTWVFGPLKSLGWGNIFLFLVWQKIAPLGVLLRLSHIIERIHLLLFLFCNIVIGRWGVIYNSINYIIFFSGLTHLGWILGGLTRNSGTALTYIFFYIFITQEVIALCYYSKISNNFVSFINKHQIIGYIMIILTLRGVPPFIGFFPKFLVITSLSSLGRQLTLISLILSAVYSMFIYMKSLYITFIVNNNQELKIYTIIYTNMNINILLIFSVGRIFLLW